MEQNTFRTLQNCQTKFMCLLCTKLNDNDHKIIDYYEYVGQGLFYGIRFTFSSLRMICFDCITLGEGI